MQKKDAIFLNRAYNDLDIQMSLIAAFAEDGRFNVRVIGYPCDGDMGTPHTHEAARYMRERLGVKFENVLDSPPAPLFLRLLYRLERVLFSWRGARFVKNILPLSWLLKAAHVGILSTMRRAFRGALPWLDRVTDVWSPAFMVCDEVLAHTGRSAMMDSVLRRKAAASIPVYVIKTGHDVYMDPAPNKADSKVKVQELSYLKSPARRFIIPGEADMVWAQQFLPEEKPEIHGNLRFDRQWIKRLHDEILVPPYLDKQKLIDKLPRDGRPRVVFMLSKLGYGIKLDEMKATIRAVANMPGIACAIKPHTRGMKFDFMDPAELGNAVIVPDIPSALLIEWADLFLFTGSSIVFHAMMLGKRVGFLQNCQYLETIFDDGRACDKFDTLNQLISFIERWRDSGAPDQSPSRLEELSQWRTRYIHGGIADGLTARHYKDTILGDIGMPARKEVA